MSASPGRRALAEALRHVGVREVPPGSNHTVFGRWFGADIEAVRREDRAPRDAVGAGVVLCRGWHGAGVGPRGVAYVPTLAAWLKATGRSVEVPQPGDLVIFDWDGGLPDHVGILISSNHEELLTVEGNTAVGNDSNGGEVMRRRRHRAQVALFGRI